MRRAVTTFSVVAALLAIVLAIDLRVRRSGPMPAPACADSLAGVLARLFPGTDSAAVGAIRWQRSPERVLRWVDGSEYAYRGRMPDRVPVVAYADAPTRTITLARGVTDCGVVKHELAHLMVPGGRVGHDSVLFTRVESYWGR